MAVSDTETTHDEGKRDFLFVATAAAGAVLTGAAVWPLVDQMNPAANVRALATIDVDLSDVPEGTQITEMWQGKPLFIRHRTPAEIEAAREVPIGDLKVADANNDNAPGAPATDDNRAIGENGQYLVMIGVCTHLGCIPLGDGAGDYGGWFCPCHGSHYDTAGRIRRGPAVAHLEIPPLEFIDDTTVRVG